MCYGEHKDSFKDVLTINLGYEKSLHEQNFQVFAQATHKIIGLYC
jgi:hypothetical protein